MDAKTMLPLELFYCYARADKVERDELDQHLAGVKRKYHITSWSDQAISPGTEWEKDIETHLNTAHIILLLVSARFMASDYCYDVEMQRALACHNEGMARVIPILLHPVYLGDAPFKKLQMLPTDAKPVSKWGNRDEAFWDVASGVARAIADLIKAWPSKEVWIDRSDALYKLRRYEEGLTACEEALKLDANYVLAWANKSYGLNELKRYEEGLAACERALQLDLSSVAAWTNKGYGLNGLKRYEEGLAACEEALRLDPNCVAAWTNKGNPLIGLGRYEESLAAYEKAIQLDPNNAVAWSNKGVVLYGLKRYEESLVAYEEALRLDPNSENSKRGRQLTLEALKKVS